MIGVELITPYMDWDNRNSRCTGNAIVGTRTMHGGIFIEASFEPNLIDGNVVWGTRGNGIYQHDCDELVIAHNLVANSSNAGVRMQELTADAPDDTM